MFALADKIDWLDHDGVNLQMLNDFLRNAYYKKLLSDCVQDKHCLDIGFGTGLLSIIALGQGAKSIVAFESDDTRYRLGLAMIAKLGLSEKIDLVHSRFTHHMYKDYSKTDIVFSETFSADLWGEGLADSLPRTPGINMVPGQFHLEIHAHEVDSNFVSGLNLEKVKYHRFSPGIDIDPEFVLFVNTCIDQKYLQPRSSVQKKIDSGIVLIEPNIQTEWGWNPHLQTIKTNPNAVAKYTIDTKTCKIETWDNNGYKVRPIDFENLECTLEVDTGLWRNALLVPRFKLSQEGLDHYLDNGTTWGPAHPAVCIVNPREKVKIVSKFVGQGLSFDFC